MNIETTAAFFRLADVAPMPFYLERDNDFEVEVKDNHGYTIFYENFKKSALPPKSKWDYYCRASAVARLLVALSNDPPPNFDKRHDSHPIAA